MPVFIMSWKDTEWRQVRACYSSTTRLPPLHRASLCPAAVLWLRGKLTLRSFAWSRPLRADSME